MKTYNISKLFFIFTLLFLYSSFVNAQMANLHGTDSEFRMGLHSGNNFWTTFFNDGTWGRVGYAPDMYPGEWPINSGHLYLLDGNPFVISEVYDNYDPITKTFLKTRGTLRRIQATVKSADIQSSTGDKGPDQTTGKWWTFLPLPGFANVYSDKIAMAKRGGQWLNSWPLYWPDIADPEEPIFSPDGWAGDWNGYFGRNKFNADEESYFVADDYQKQEFPGFRPDTNNINRGGLGIRKYERGFQWEKTEIADVLFCHYEFKNIGTYNHNKMVFGYKVGNNIGETRQGSEGWDGGSYNIEHNIAWSWDDDGFGHSTWGTEYGIHTGVFGVCLLETPGIPYDGIDNDNDGINGPGNIITTSMFQKRVLTANELIVLINYNDPLFTRIVTTLTDTLTKLGKNPTDTLYVSYFGFTYKFCAGDTLREIGDNLFDDNLNGIIDENRGVTRNNVTNYLYIDHKYINYITGEGLSNLLIDERRDDGIDNNGNWNLLTDDIGADGLVPNEPDYPGPDYGEGDGRPTVGEPHFDKTDVEESDMLGLTSFFLYHWGYDFSQFDDEKMWQIFTPGSFVTSPVGNVELSFGSGYFHLPPKKSERFSIALIAASAEPTGKDTIALFNTKRNVSEVYCNNYKLPTIPKMPRLTGYTEGKKVFLSWDSLAEKSYDPVLGYDFEGYRIYKTTNPNIIDSSCIVAQFDLKNEYSGYSPIPKRGRYFWLGNNSGIQRSWIDSNVIYGIDYYYIITSYDHGNTELNVPPSECEASNIFINSSGDVITGVNAVHVIPKDPKGINYPIEISTVNGLTEGTVKSEIIDTRLVKSNHTYRITFQDTLSIGQVKNFTLTDMTSGSVILNEIPFYNQFRNIQVVEGFRLTLENPYNGELKMDATLSGWNRTGVAKANFNIFQHSSNPPIKAINGDFKLIIDTVGIDTSISYKFGSRTWVARPVNFTILNTRTNEKVKFAFYESDFTGGSGKLTINRTGSLIDQIVFLTPMTPGSDSLIASWWLYLQRTIFSSDTLLPDAGDTLTIKLTKPFLADNVFEFTMPNIPVSILEQNDNSIPKSFALSQNYPNPFNPTTSINFSLPVKSSVRLLLINILGQTVKEITNGIYDAGHHKIILDASKLATGIYFYRLETNTGFFETKKLVLIK